MIPALVTLQAIVCSEAQNSRILSPTHFSSRTMYGFLTFTFVLCFIGCATPPTKEMNQAQDAIDAAGSAGADQYAPDEYAAAIAILENAKKAVENTDYRLGLNYALQAREEAQKSVEQAAKQKVLVRREVEQILDAAALELEELDRRLVAAQTARIPVRQMAQSRMTRSAVEAAMHEAHTALSQSDYISARNLAKGLSEMVRKVIREIDIVLRDP